MRLRRIMERARQLQWPAVATELVIVILGVFIGMQVSNWNAGREARQRGAMFAERLKAGQRTIVDSFINSTLRFADIVGFTRIAARQSPHRPAPPHSGARTP